MPHYYHNWARLDETIEGFFAAALPRMEVQDTEDSRAAEPGATIFVHAHVKSDWMEKAEQNPGTNYIFLSRAPADLADIDKRQLSNVHICDFPAGRLSEFPQFKEFLAQLEEGKVPDWSLLRRRSPSQLIVAAYVLLLAKETRGGLNFEQLESVIGLADLWRSATRDVGSEASHLPKSWREFASMDQAEVAKAIEQAKAYIKRIAT